MIVFSLDVDNQNLKLRKYNKEIITTNSVNYFECSINFNGFWNNHDVQKSIIFYQSTKYKYEIALFDNKCVIPSEVLQHPEMPLFIGMVGINEDPYTILTTNIVCIDLTEGILRSNTQSPEITPTIYDQLLSEFHTMYDDVINRLSNKQDKLTPENAGDNIAITYDGDIVKISASGEISANYEDLNHLPKINNTTIVGNLSLSDIGIPTKTSELTNDSGFITNTVDDLTNYYTKSELSTVATTGSYTDLTDKPTIPTKTSDLDNDSGFIDNTVNDLTNYYNKSEVNTELTKKVDKEQGKGLFSGSYNDLTNKPTIPTKTSDLTNDSGFITNAVNNLLNYYVKSETYTKNEVNNLISTISTMSLQVVQVLPTEDIQTNIIYLVPRQTVETNNTYDEYIYVNNAWEKIGSTDVDLTGYATETWVNTQISGFLTQVQIENLITTALNNYYTQTQTDNLLSAKQNIIDSTHKLDYSLVDNTPTIPTVDQTYDGTSANAQSGVAVAGAIQGKLDTNKVTSSQSTTSGEVYDVTYINTMIGNIENLLSEV